MNVVLAERAGFCMGVSLALKKLDKLLDSGQARPIYVLGPIIHNPQVLERYSAKGVHMAKNAEEIPDGSIAVIRAHGVPHQVEESLNARDIIVEDATCPKVKKAQLLIEDHSEDDTVLLLFGEEDHPEVRGLVSYAPNEAFVFGSVEELEAYPLEPGVRYVLAAQTTQDREQFEALARRFGQDERYDVDVLHTICDATRHRQAEAVRLAQEVEFMVVVGGKNSGNTRRLAKVVADQGTPSLHVETAEELPVEQLRQYNTVGLTAGASTPNDLVRAVKAALESME